VLVVRAGLLIQGRRMLLCIERPLLFDGGCKRCEQTGGRKHISVLDANNVLLCAQMAVQRVHGMVIILHDERRLDGSFANLFG
jgi:hypothetical protein